MPVSSDSGAVDSFFRPESMHAFTTLQGLSSGYGPFCDIGQAADVRANVSGSTLAIHIS